MENLSSEIWKSVKDFEGLYEVSNLGRIRSIGYGEIKILKGRDDGAGYLKVALFKDKKRHEAKVHRLVCNAFIKNRDNRPFVNHKNLIRNDNRLENLEWCTHSENIKHAYNMGSLSGMKGSKHKLAKLTNEKILEIRNIKNMSNAKISKIYNVSSTTIRNIINNKTWNHI